MRKPAAPSWNWRASRDAAAFDGLLAAYRASKERPNPALVEQAELHVTEVPLYSPDRAARLELAVEVAASANINAMSDACSAASLANSTCFGSGTQREGQRQKPC